MLLDLDWVREKLLPAGDEMVFLRGDGIKRAIAEADGGNTWLSFPHISEDLDVASDLFL